MGIVFKKFKLKPKNKYEKRVYHTIDRWRNVRSSKNANKNNSFEMKIDKKSKNYD